MLELVSLTLHENKFVTSLPKDLGNLANLKHLILSNNTLTGSIPENVLRLPSLGYLWLDHNYFVGNITNQTCKTMSDDIDLRIDYHAITCDCCEHRTIDN
jgi:Leucine-rich repeat (LRR) protein